MCIITAVHVIIVICASETHTTGRKSNFAVKRQNSTQLITQLDFSVQQLHVHTNGY